MNNKIVNAKILINKENISRLDNNQISNPGVDTGGPVINPQMSGNCINEASWTDRCQRSGICDLVKEITRRVDIWSSGEADCPINFLRKTGI